MTTVLNIAGGKLKPLGLNRERESFLVNCDTMYYDIATPEYVEAMHDRWLERRTDLVPVDEKHEYFIKTNVFEFMERTKIIFDEIACYRFLEHVSKDQVLYFIYLMANCLDKGCFLDVIVPNYEVLAKNLLGSCALRIGSKLWNKNEVILNTEMLNEKSDPHCSIWTPDRIKYYFEFEDRFQVSRMTPNFEFDGRDIYLRAEIQRV